MQKTSLKLNGCNWQVYLRDTADQSVFNEIFKLKEYRAANDVIKTAKYPIVDVGAHAGFFSMYCRALNDKVKIFAIEPEPENLKLLNQHLADNKILGVEVVAGALASESGERQLILSVDSHNHHLAETDGAFSERLFADFADADVTADKTTVVHTFSFADFCNKNKIKNISLVKMDIEGGEYELFESLSEANLSMVNYIILEYHMGIRHKEIAEKLRANGFGVQVHPSHFDKTMGFIWANNKRTKF